MTKFPVARYISTIGVTAATVVLLAAPHAAAASNTYTMSVTGSSHVAGCAYTLSIDNPPATASAAFYDNGQRIGPSSGSGSLTGRLETKWTPATAGTHTLTASMGYLSTAVYVDPLTVEVTSTGTCAGGGLGSLLPSISG
ncbi:hypothetical protein [Nocardia arizonensis]|uniref:hypothetical protein n=1 Tax=Nocardia arizonensis TaxID=1141647 RepID=UPI001471790F